ncbi:hypothetical protein WJX72_005494 [[Myrmecia] bisecta]|uniref:Uncharacterized protein n=1 Tax=[Myrmecia] bisecta TaxID=41462 RepID=A0AAW1P7A1_9CHLO
MPGAVQAWLDRHPNAKYPPHATMIANRAPGSCYACGATHHWRACFKVVNYLGNHTDAVPSTVNPREAIPF